MKCSVEDCNKDSHCKGWCVVHYGRWYRNGDPLVSQRVKNQGKTCLVDNCNSPAYIKLMCQLHGNRAYRNGDPLIVRRGGENDTRWRGGRHVNKDGYVNVWIDPSDPLYCMSPKGKNYVREHRLVVARSLGRPLTSKETVHHINGDTSDNRIENLQLRSGAHGQGVVLQCCKCGSRDIESALI